MSARLTTFSPTSSKFQTGSEPGLLMGNADGDLQYDFTKGPRSSSLSQRLTDMYMKAVMDLTCKDLQFARALFVRPAWPCCILTFMISRMDA